MGFPWTSLGMTGKRHQNVLQPPLHIKLGLVKHFVKALDFEGEVFQEIRLMFPKLSEAKINGGIFVGPQKNTLLKSKSLKPWKKKRMIQSRKRGKHFKVWLMDFRKTKRIHIAKNSFSNVTKIWVVACL